MRHESLSAWVILGIIMTVTAALAISVVPMGVGPDAMPWPNLTVCVVFFWLVHRSDGLPMLAILGIGLAHDLIGGGILGSGMIAFLIASLFVRPMSKQLNLSPFGIRWMAFTGFAAGVFVLEWALTSLPRLASPPVGGWLAQFLVTVLAYPVVSVLFRRVLRIGRT